MDTNNIFSSFDEIFSKTESEVLKIITSPPVDFKKLEEFGSVEIKTQKNGNSMISFKSHDGRLYFKKKLIAKFD